MSASKSLPWQHSHRFDTGNPLAEKRTFWAMLLTIATMIVEIFCGMIFNSMALLADGWHMSSHALALGLSFLAYNAARKYAHDKRFTFGTWKIEILCGYTSALLLGLIGVFMIYQSVLRIITPADIHYNEAIIIAIFGLIINLACAWLLHEHHHHGNDHEHLHATGHSHDHHHHDLNLHAAYLHVLADAATSLLAIIALFAGKLWGASWLDPVMGIVGALLVLSWAKNLIKMSGKILLEAENDAPLADKIRQMVANEHHGFEMTDLHLWRVGKDKYALILALAVPKAAQDTTPDYFRMKLAAYPELAHVTVELNPL